MLFSSLTFLYGFLPLTVAAYFVAPRRLRNGVLLVASLVFYGWGGPGYLALMSGQILLAYFSGRLIDRWRQARWAKAWFATAVVLTLASLLLFKYADFTVRNLDAVFGFGFEPLRWTLPLGISFYTFQILSYLLDLQRGKIAVQRNLLAFATYVALFPQLVAGPIVRYSDVEHDLAHREHSLERVAGGCRRFVVGLAKKVLLANTLGQLATLMKSAALCSDGGDCAAVSNGGALAAWLYLIAFSLQIYFDFSGYSDMAIGMGQMFGFRFPENFNFPYVARSITEFWRRWHMSLSSWFRDYLYFPLGGSRRGKRRTCLNLLIVWCLTGFWHGAEWNFLLWGAYYAALLIVEKFVLRAWLEKLPTALRHLYALILVLLGWVLFDAANVQQAGAMLGALFGGSGGASVASQYYLRSFAVPLLIGMLGATPLVRHLAIGLTKRYPRGQAWLEPIVLAGLLVLVTACLVDSSFNPFIYFRF